MKSLFRRYEAALNRRDFESLAGMFEESFLLATPRSVAAQDQTGFLEMEDQMTGYYQAIGQTSARILDLDERPISPDFSLVRAHWGATFEKLGNRLVEYDVSYIVNKSGPDPKVAMVIAHHDEEKALQELGLTPDYQGA